MRIKLIMEIDGRNVAEITSDNLSPDNEQAQYDFEYDQNAHYLICLIMADCISGIEEIESKYAGCSEVLH